MNRRNDILGGRTLYWRCKAQAIGRMKIHRGAPRWASLLIILSAVGIGAWAWTGANATVQLAPAAVLKLDTGRIRGEFRLGAVGFSTEADELSTGSLSASHYALVRLMRLLGPSMLRIGGDSVNRSWWTSRGESSPSWATNTVTPVDLQVLHGLLRATGWRVLLGVDLGHFDPERAADEAHVAHAILGGALAGVEIGNEPDDFSGKKDLRPRTYGVREYLSEAEAYRQALSRSAPHVAVYGPALGLTRWLTEMGGATRMFTEITQHHYPTSTCSQTPTAEPQPTAAELLSPAVRQRENGVLAVLTKAGRVTGRPTRIGETNTASCRGGVSVSPVLASAVWALDWTLRAASKGVSGMNFHGNLRACTDTSESPLCAPRDAVAKAGDLVVQPEYYGLLAASRLEGGRFVATRVSAPAPLPNLTTWATIAPGGTITIAIDNLATGGLAQPVSIPATGYIATEESLTCPSVDARSGIALGGAQVTSSGRWRPRPAALRRTHGSVRVVVRAACASIVSLRPRRSRG